MNWNDGVKFEAVPPSKGLFPDGAWNNKLKRPMSSNAPAPLAAGNQPAGATGNQTPSSNSDGQLARLMDMPLDIIFEVASALHTRDLLCLSRASKQFYHMFMSRKSLSVWKNARNNVPGLPECPPNLSEPQYAALMFELDCLACGGRNHQITELFVSIRLCTLCWNVNFRTGIYLISAYCKEHGLDPKSKLVMSIKNDIFTSLPRYHCFGWAYKLAEGDESDQYYKPEFDLALDRMFELKDDESRYEEFVAERRAFTLQMIETVTFGRIFNRLYELGYHSEDFPVTLERDWSLNSSVPLMPAELDEIIPKFEAMIAEVKREAEQLARFRRFGDAYRTAFKSLADPEDRWMTPHPDHPSFKLTTYQLFSDNGAEIECEGPQYEKVVKALMDWADPGLKNEMKTNIITGLRSILASGTDSNDTSLAISALSDDQLLGSAVGLFTCSFFCSVQLYGYTECLEHIVLYHPRAAWPFFRAAVPRPHLDYITIARDVLESLGLPLRTTCREISGKILCTCHKPGFQQPASFYDLLRHIGEENAWLDKMSDCLAYEPSPALTTILHNDHDLTHSMSILRLGIDPPLPEPKLVEIWPWTVPPIRGDERAYCGECVDVAPRGREHWFRVDLRSLTAFSHHLQTKHLKDPEEKDLRIVTAR